MENYRQLAIRYLKMNKRRSLVTVFGVIVATTVLYVILNLGWSALLHYRDTIREKGDYEIVLLTQTQDQIDQILKDERVKSAYVGSYYYYDYYEPVTYNNALYININHPYRMDSILEQLKSTYGVEGEQNWELAWTYMQGGEGNTTVIMILSLLLISFIFAIFGVGIVRNSIQLSTLEQIKDYGNLRCIGATKKQLKSIVYMEGAILEIAGMIAGVIVGTLCTTVAGHFMKLSAGFHLVPVVPIAVAFLGDLMFAMEENCKIITNMSPISAIRGEYRIRKEKIRVRKSNIFGKLFGVEGDYAYKSIMRNPGRFWKTVWSIGIGMGAFIMMAGLTTSLNEIVKDKQKMWKYYHVFYESYLTLDRTMEEVQSEIPPTSFLEQISELDGLTEAKRIYCVSVALADPMGFYDHYTEDYLAKSENGAWIKKLIENEKENPSFSNMLSEFDCYGYAEEDYQRYEKALVAGTLDVSDHGIVLVNHETLPVNEDVLYDSETAVAEYMKMDYTSYKVGDTIDVIDMAKLRELIAKERSKPDKEYKEETEKLSEEFRLKKISQEEKDTKETELLKEYNLQKYQIVADAREKLQSEGAYKTYTIEGIVNEDVNTYSVEPHFILPLDKYYTFTGTDESMAVGMQYHFERFPTREFMKIQENIYAAEIENETYYIESGYALIMSLLDGFKYSIVGGMLVILFVVTMTTLNIINTTASSLHLRRKEFAQLRVIGISKKRLMKMVMLEGVISVIVANIIGIGLGALLSFGLFRLIMTTLYGFEYTFSVVGMVIGMVMSVLILCGSVYLPLRGLKQDVAGDLSTGGE
ncbi:MAG: ABC transporter permease [Lachnospiraceae bacterium]